MAFAVTLRFGATLVGDNDDDDDVPINSKSAASPSDTSFGGAGTVPRQPSPSTALTSYSPVFGKVAGSPSELLPFPPYPGGNGAALEAHSSLPEQVAGTGDSRGTGHRSQFLARRRHKSRADKFG